MRPDVPHAPALAWTAVLASLGLVWVRSPVVGEGFALGVWSLPAVVVFAWSWFWFRTRGFLPGTWFVLLVLALWGIALGLAWMDLGREMALDGLILRQPGLRRTGEIVRWMPFGFAALLSLGMLVSSLEIRYRLIHPEKYA